MAEGGTVQQALGLLGGGWGRGKCVMHTEDTVQQALRVLGDGWGRGKCVTAQGGSVQQALQEQELRGA